MARVMKSHVCAPPTHVLGNLVLGATQALESVRNGYAKAMVGLSAIDTCSFKVLVESSRHD